MNKSLLKCGLENNCLDDTIAYTIELLNIQNMIVTCISEQKEIKISLLNDFKKTYKKFSKSFFSKKTVDCLIKNCKNQLPDVINDIQKMLNQANFFRNQIIKHSRSKHNRIYIRILDLAIEIIHDFSDNYKKKYLNIK